MTDSELRDQAVAALKATTVSYPVWLKKTYPDRSKTQWGKAFSLLEQIGQPDPPQAPTETMIGVYKGAGQTGWVKEFEQQLGRPVDVVVDFLAMDSWASIEGPGWSLDPWQGSPWVLSLSVPMLAPGCTLAQGATGQFDSHFAALARNLKARGLDNSIIRLGWEFGGSWYRWSVKTQADATNYASYWRKIVTAMRAVAPGLWFDWNGIWSQQPVNPGNAYPGDAFVDFVGCDIYDQSWVPGFQNPDVRWNDMTTGPYSINWWAGFAKQHGKELSVPEWGLAVRDDGHGGGDAPSFITGMADWLAANKAGYHAYFDFDAPDGVHELKNFPKSRPVFVQRFGA